MADETKFTDDELKSLQELQEKYQTKQAELGQLAVQRVLHNQRGEALEKTTEKLEKEYEAIQQEESNLVKSLNEKYGPGQLDPTTGVFTPVTPNT